ncbi:carbon-nitrogen hydrolase family protein [Candidatus Hydrogenedentota bacterium]
MIRLGLIKAVPVKWDVEANWKTFEMLARRGAERGAQLIVTPECFLDGYVSPVKKGFSKARLAKVSQPLRGPGYVKRARELARELAVHFVFGFSQKARNGSYNAAALINDSGKVLGVYHKTHLHASPKETHDLRYLPGKALNVWETSLGRIGIMICADRRWPETARTLKVKGAQLIANPTYGMCHLDNEWWMRTRSYENEIYIAFTHPEVSLITGPRGQVDAKLESNMPDILVHDIDLDNLPRDMFPYRRADIYTK